MNQRNRKHQRRVLCMDGPPGLETARLSGNSQSVTRQRGHVDGLCPRSMSFLMTDRMAARPLGCAPAHARQGITIPLVTVRAKVALYCGSRRPLCILGRTPPCARRRACDWPIFDHEGVPQPLRIFRSKSHRRRFRSVGSSRRNSDESKQSAACRKQCLTDVARAAKGE